MRRFEFDRQTDVSGTSGTGAVAEGVQFYDGTCAVRWRTAINSTCFYDSIDDVIKIHGHDGATNLKWIDDDDVIEAEIVDDRPLGELIEKFKVLRTNAQQDVVEGVNTHLPYAATVKGCDTMIQAEHCLVALSELLGSLP